jgi:hypothetical protein
MIAPRMIVLNEWFPAGSSFLEKPLPLDLQSSHSFVEHKYSGTPVDDHPATTTKFTKS